jgi:hypothetical protein
MAMGLADKDLESLHRELESKRKNTSSIKSRI